MCGVYSSNTRSLIWLHLECIEFTEIIHFRKWTYNYLQNTGAVATPEVEEVDHSMKEGGNQKRELYQEGMEHNKVVIQK